MFALSIVMEEKQLKEGDLKILVGCLMLCYHRELSDIFTKKKKKIIFLPFLVLNTCSKHPRNTRKL